MNSSDIMLSRRRRPGALGTELLVVVAVLSVLSAVAIPAVGRISSVARQSRLAATLRELQAAVDAYYLVAGSPPRIPCEYSWAVIDFDAQDPDTLTFTPAYFRWRPDSSAQVYGLKAEKPVFFGVTPLGKVFATQDPPDQICGWSKIPEVVHTSSDPGGVPGASIENPEDDPAMTEVTSVVAQVSATSAAAGSAVVVTATAYSDNGMGIPGVPLRFAIKGSVSGERSLWAVTGANGSASVHVGTDDAELISVTVFTDG